MNRGNETASYKTEDNARRQIVLAKSVTKLEVLVKHRAQRQRDRLQSAALVRYETFDEVDQRITNLKMDVGNGRGVWSCRLLV